MRGRPAVIFASGPTWTSLLVGYFLALATRAPFVVDFRDPWVGSAFHAKREKYQAHRIAREWLERLVVRKAVHVTCAWEGIRQLLMQRYPKKKEYIATIVNGFSPEDFEGLQDINLFDGCCVFLHAGTFYSHRSPEPLLSALRRMVDTGMPEVEIARFVFLGNPTYNGRPLVDMVKEEGLEEIVYVLPPVPQREALEYLKGAQVAVLFGQSGSDALASIPAKAFEYIGLGKPVLAIGAGDEVCSVLDSGGCPLWRVTLGQESEMMETIKNIVSLFTQKRLPRANSGAYHYTRATMAAKIEQILKDSVVIRKS
jgi:glycosyltransferase involved in cell wall biosynthesis